MRGVVEVVVVLRLGRVEHFGDVWMNFGEARKLFGRLRWVVAVEGEAVAAVVVRPGPALAAAVAVAVALDAAFACPGAASVASDASGQGIAGSALVAWLFCPEGSQTDLPVETLDLD